MKIGVVGCGALGSYYGGLLARSGQETHFLLRTDFPVVRDSGVRILSPKGDFTVRPRAADRPQDIGVCDLVLIGLKATANDQFPHLLPPLTGPDTAILTLQNGLGNEEALAKLFAPRQILGGLCFVCLNRIAPGVVQHLDHGLVVLGEFSGPVCDRTRAILGAFQSADIPSRISDDLARAHWEKLVWNIPFNGLGVAGVAGYEFWQSGAGLQLGPVLDTAMLLRDARWEALVLALMLEVIHGARGLGYDLNDSMAEQMITRTRSMGSYKASTLLDYERGLPLELESLFREPLRRAQSAGVTMPLLNRLCEVLTRISCSPGPGQRDAG